MASAAHDDAGQKVTPPQTRIQLDDKVGVIVLTNADDSNPADITDKLMDTVSKAIAKAAADKPAIVPWDPAWERFAGLYRGRHADVQVVLLNKKLVTIRPNAPDLDPSVTLEPLGGGRFRFMAPTGGLPVGEVVRFVEEPGRPMRMYTGDSWVDRIATP